jgi:L-alanine-DL-glutamate epimerase-like enolase superfamily enzyme
MRIVDAHVDHVAVPLGSARGGSGATQVDLVIVRLTADEGEGVGFTYSLNGAGDALARLCEQLVLPHLRRVDTEDWPSILERLWAASGRLGVGMTSLAIAAADIAVWDLRAVGAGLPLHRLLGATRDEIALYGSGRATHAMSTQELVEGAQSYVEEGYTAVKLRIGARPAPDDVARIAAVRDAVGPGVLLMVDCNERLDLPTALWCGRELEQLSVYWLEEPLPARQVAAHRTLVESLSIPIAVGEHLHDRHAFQQYLRAGAASIVMPDAPIAGGITEFVRIATIAEAFGVALTPHFLPELHLHVALASPTCRWIEHFPLIDDVLTDVVRPDHGIVRAPDVPGHGVRFDEEALSWHGIRRIA